MDGAGSLLDRTTEPVEQLMPLLKRFAATLSPEEVEAAVQLIDRLPGLLDTVDRDVLPLTQQLNAVGPDLHALLELVEDLHRLVSNLPGVNRLRRRAQEDEEAEV